MFKRSFVLVAAVVMAVIVHAVVVSAHEGHGIEALSFDRPEAWALKYFASATLFSGLETPRTRKPWSISFGVEFGWIKPVSDANRFVGFDGTKQEDLNKAPFFLRPRVTIGLPGRFALLVGVNPPVSSFGVTPRLLALGLERPIYEREAWIVGVRGYGQVGTVKGAYTCPSSVLAFAPGSAGNLYGCQAESSDTATLRYIGGEVSVAHNSTGRKLSPHAAIGVNYLDVAFHVDALTFGFEDHTQYVSRGVTVSGSAGVSYPLAHRLSVAADVFYSPLPVQRAGITQNNGFFNVRALLTYQLR
jgi:hypothetical protein